MVGQPKNHISDLQLENYTTPAKIQCWKTSFKTEVCSGSNYPSESMRWIKEVEMATSVGDLKTSRSIFGNPGPNFETLDAKIVSSLKIILEKSHFRQVHAEEQAQKDDRFHRGKQIAFMIFEHFRVTGTHVDYSNLFRMFYMATMFKVLIPDVKKSCQSTRYPRTILWKACTRCVYEGLINSKLFWHCANEMSHRTSHNRATEN